PARLGLAGHAETDHHGHAAGPTSLPSRPRPPRGAPPGHAARAPARVGGDPGPRSHRVAPAGGAAPGQRPDGPDAAAARRPAGARAGPRTALRLPREPAAVSDRDAAVLPPRRVVGVAPRARRARALLRRSCGRRVRRRALLRDRAAWHGAAPQSRARLFHGGRGRLAGGAGPAAHGASAGGDVPARARWRSGGAARTGTGDRWLPRREVG